MARLQTKAIPGYHWIQETDEMGMPYGLLAPDHPAARLGWLDEQIAQVSNVLAVLQAWRLKCATSEVRPFLATPGPGACYCREANWEYATPDKACSETCSCAWSMVSQEHRAKFSQLVLTDCKRCATSKE